MVLRTVKSATEDRGNSDENSSKFLTAPGPPVTFKVFIVRQNLSCPPISCPPYIYVCCTIQRASFQRGSAKERLFSLARCMADRNISIERY